MDFTSFHNDMLAKKIKSANLRGERIEGEYLDGSKFKTVIPEGSVWELVKGLEENGVRIRIEESANSSPVYAALASWMPFALLLGFFMFLIVAMKIKTGTTWNSATPDV